LPPLPLKDVSVKSPGLTTCELTLKPSAPSVALLPSAKETSNTTWPVCVLPVKLSVA
jgi:hypothetical protein